MRVSHSVFAMVLLLAVHALGQEYEVRWRTVDGGGATTSSGGAFEAAGTIGQPDAQVPPVMAGGSFELVGGFWPVTQICTCPADMNGDGLKDGRDAQMFVDCFLAGGSCSCADVDAMNGVDLEDINLFVGDLLAGDSCP